MTKIISLYGCPGSGKSTLAAELFVKLKKQNKKVELLTEYAKQLVYHDRLNTLQEQIYVFAKQLHYMQNIVSKVDYLVTDSGLILSALYAPSWYPKCFSELVVDANKRYDNLNIWVNRVKPYLQYGRTQTVEESDELAVKFKFRLKNEFNLHLVEVDGDDFAPDKVLEILAKEEQPHVG